MEGSSPERGPPCHRSDSLNGAPWLRRKAEEAPGRAMGSIPLGTLTGEAGSVSLYWLSFWRCPLDSTPGFGFFFFPLLSVQNTQVKAAPKSVRFYPGPCRHAWALLPKHSHGCPGGWAQTALVPHWRGYSFLKIYKWWGFFVDFCLPSC